MKASDLPVGTKVVLNSGAYYATHEAEVTSQDPTPFGVNTWVRVSPNSEEEEAYDTTIDGQETLLGIGWRLAH